MRRNVAFRAKTLFFAIQPLGDVFLNTAHWRCIANLDEFIENLGFQG